MASHQEVEALLARVSLGDRPAFKALYGLTAGVLLATATRVLQDRSAAEDVVQDVFAQLWHQASETAAPARKTLAWLCVVTRNRAVDHLRKRPSEVPLQRVMPDGEETTHDAPSDNPGVFEQLSFEQDQQQLRHCLDRLEPEPRQAVLLAYMEGLTHAELAARMQRPLGTIKAWTRRSLMALKLCMGSAT